MQRRMPVAAQGGSLVWLCSVLAAGASPAAETFHEGPAYHAGAGGYRNPYLAFIPSLPPTLTVNNLGRAVGWAQAYDSGDAFIGNRALRFDPTGFAAAELPMLGADGGGFTHSFANAVNDAGVAVGSARLYSGGVSFGSRAVRWIGDGVTQLGHLGDNGLGNTASEAWAINGAGVAVGYAQAYEAGVLMGHRAVRWNAGSTAAVELDHLGLRDDGWTDSRAYAINSANHAAGYAHVFSGSDDRGPRAVRWNATGHAQQLDDLGTDSAGFTISRALAINDAGDVVGFANRYGGFLSLGGRPVRWEAGSASATELGVLGCDPFGATVGQALAINEVGDAVGYVHKYNGSGDFLGSRAVRWNAGTTAPLELANLGTASNGLTNTFATAINSAGLIVGYATEYDNGVDLGQRAVLWDSAGVITDLNDYLPANANWVLEYAHAISDAGFIVGSGLFDPDGTGSALPYHRMFLLDLDLGLPLVLGDFNLDGQRTNTDIQAMLDALVDLEGYKALHGLNDAALLAIGDINGDQAVTNTDIQAMLDLLTGGDAQAVPEPASALLLAAAVGLAAVRRRVIRRAA